jgi:hypothetical protein
MKTVKLSALKEEAAIKALKELYESACNGYVELFSKKQGIEFDGWVGDEVGGIASFIHQYFFDISEIVYDINTNQPKGLIIEWQQDMIENGNVEINYYSYSKGLRLKDVLKQ